MQTECCVVGGGVVGLAVARALRRFGKFAEVLVLEKERTIGSGTSSRNSEVIHSGIYYAKDSLPLKAKFCVEGRKLMYDFCQQHNVPHKKCGKLVVASSQDEIPALELLLKRGRENEVDGLEILDSVAANTLACPNTPGELKCEAALWSPETGIVSSHEFMEALVSDGDFDIAFGSRVTKISPISTGSSSSSSSAAAISKQHGFRVTVAVDGQDRVEEIECKTVVNCAGLSAQELVRTNSNNNDHDEAKELKQIYGHHPSKVKYRFAKGNYFKLVGQRPPFSTLVYPVPPSSYNLGGLGVHYTIDMAGNAKFGPDVEWVDSSTPPLDVEVQRGVPFYRSVRRYWPGLRDGALQPDYSGVRPKLSGPGESAADFGVFEEGYPGVVHLMGIESPGLTSSMALANFVTGFLRSAPEI